MKATKNHCKYCFQTLIAKLEGKQMPKYPETQIDVEVPIFVTWRKNGVIRGCIGTFAPGKLSTILGQYALISSLEDSRFKPIGLQELKQLSVGVSLLLNFQQTKSIYDWIVGKHGIWMYGQHKGRKYSGTYLPDVILQQKWDQKQTLQNVVKKAGFYDSYQEIQNNLNVRTYQSSKEYMTYEQYVKSK